MGGAWQVEEKEKTYPWSNRPRSSLGSSPASGSPQSSQGKKKKEGKKNKGTHNQQAYFANWQDQRKRWHSWKEEAIR